MAKSVIFLIFLISFFGFSQTEKFTIKNLEINTEYPHFGLMLVNDSKIIFTSYLLDKKERLKRFQGNPILTIFEGELSENGKIQNIKNIEIDPEQHINNITSATMNSNGKQLFITTTLEENTVEENFQIKVGEFKDGLGWTNFKTLPFCNSKYSYAHPALSEDGKTLYFTSNIRGGKEETTKGGSDIFKVEILENNTFSEPINLGSNVNSYSKEMFPFIADDNTLYFASNRPGGFGNFDIYKSKMTANGTFEKAVKLPKPINSISDDFCFIINSNTNSGYFSSKRDGGKGDDDVYYFTLN